MMSGTEVMPLVRRRRPTRLSKFRLGIKSTFSRDWRGVITTLVILMFLWVVLSMPYLGGTGSQLSAYDDDWNDISVFRRDMEDLSYLPIDVRTVSTSAASLTSILDARRMLYMAVGVERPYTIAEWRALRLFMQRGGQVLVALLKYHGFEENPAVSHMGATPITQYIFSGKRLSDIKVDRNPQLVRLSVPIWEGLEYEVLLNDPSCFVMNEDWYDLEPWISQGDLPDEAQIIANSSEGGWLDEDRDGVRDPGEESGEFPVIIFQDGMILLSDPSIFTNDM